MKNLIQIIEGIGAGRCESVDIRKKDFFFMKSFDIYTG